MRIGYCERRCRLARVHNVPPYHKILRRPLNAAPPHHDRFLIASAIGAIAALPLPAKAGPAPVPTFQAEKCFGVAVAGRNDCGASGHATQLGGHSCAGSATRTGEGLSWIYVPVGTCQKISGGSLTPKV